MNICKLYFFSCAQIAPYSWMDSNAHLWQPEVCNSRFFAHFESSFPPTTTNNPWNSHWLWIHVIPACLLEESRGEGERVAACQSEKQRSHCPSECRADLRLRWRRNFCCSSLSSEHISQEAAMFGPVSHMLASEALLHLLSPWKLCTRSRNR